MFHKEKTWEITIGLFGSMLFRHLTLVAINQILCIRLSVIVFKNVKSFQIYNLLI